MELNFQVDNEALEVIRNTPITANFDEMKEGLKELVAPYKNVIVSEDAITNAKSDRARLNKVESNIDNYRKTVKRIYTEPLTKFEEKCKELSAICKEATRNLDVQIKAFEQKKKEEKKKNLEGYFFEQAGGYAQYVTFAEVFNEKWLNATFSFDSAKTEIDRMISKVAADVNCICGLASPFGKTLLEEYTKTKDLARCIQLNTKLTEQAKEEEERLRAKMEAEKQAAIEAAKKEAEAKAAAKEEEPEPEPFTAEEVPVEIPTAIAEPETEEEPVPPFEPDPDFYYINPDEGQHLVQYTMTLDDQQLTEVRLFLTVNNIVYVEKFS